MPHEPRSCLPWPPSSGSDQRLGGRKRLFTKSWSVRRPIHETTTAVRIAVMVPGHSEGSDGRISQVTAAMDTIQQTAVARRTME